MDIENTYRTKDLPLASFLYASGEKLIDFSRQNGIVWFVFADKTFCENLASCFWRGEAMVNARGFVNASRSLKDLIFQAAEGIKPISDLVKKTKDSLSGIEDIKTKAEGALRNIKPINGEDKR